MYLVIQKGYAIFGQGSTPDQAVKDMKQWIDSDSPMQDWTVDDFNTSYYQANDAEMVLIVDLELAEQLLQQYQ